MTIPHGVLGNIQELARRPYGHLGCALPEASCRTPLRSKDWRPLRNQSATVAAVLTSSSIADGQTVGIHLTYETIVLVIIMWWLIKKEALEAAGGRQSSVARNHGRGR